MFVNLCTPRENKYDHSSPSLSAIDAAIEERRWEILPDGFVRVKYREINQMGRWESIPREARMWRYCETDQERAWANEMDRKHLRLLVEKDPDKFLEEMTPNPLHDGTCVGLDLDHSHHVDLQNEFQSEVRRICEEKGLTEHPALINPQKDQQVIDGSSKPSEKIHQAQQNEITALKATILKLKSEMKTQKEKIEQQNQTIQQTLDEKNNLREKHDALLTKYEQNQEKIQRLIDENATLKGERQIFSDQVTKLTEQNQTLITDKDTLQERIIQYTRENKQLQRKLTTILNPRSSWLRVWEGKYSLAGETPKYEPIAAKKEGCTIGFIAETPKGKQYLAKLGLLDTEYKVAPTLSTRKHGYQRSIMSVITEKIGADVYAVLGHGFYYVPKHRLARLKILNPFTKSDPHTNAVIKKLNQNCKEGNQISEGVHLMSRWMEQYRDIDQLEQCLREKNDTEPKAFLDCLAAGYVPEYAAIEEQVVPILGLMEVLAASRLLADTDVLGGGGKNAGYVVERNSEGAPLAARMVKVDAGEAFNFSGEHNQLIQSFNPLSSAIKLKNYKDLQFGNQQPITIPWSGLIDRQRNAFLQALKRGLTLLSHEPVLNFFIHRRGEFDRAVLGDRIVMIEAMVKPFKEAWQVYREAQERTEIYGDAMAEAKELAPIAVPFRPKMYGAVNHQADEAIRLSVEGAEK